MSAPTQAGSTSKPAKKGFQAQKDCLHWKKGQCVFGSKCRFRHDPALKGLSKSTNSGITSVPGVGERLELPLTTELELNNTTGGAHPTTAAQSSAVRSTAGKHASHVPQNKPGVCWKWRAGKCTRGLRCRYRHEELGSNIARAGNTTIPMKLEVQEGGDERFEAITDRTTQSTSKISPRAGQTISQSTKIQPGRESGGIAGSSGREAEELVIKEIQARARADAVERARLARERRERDKVLKQERARRAEEEKQRREAERLAREKEAEEAKKQRQVQREKEAAVVEQYVVQDSSLVTFAAGLQIRNVVPGFELCRIAIKNLPRDARHNEIADLFLQQGVDQSEFFISQVKPELAGSRKLEATVLANVHHGRLIAEGLQGIEFRNEALTFSVSNNASLDSMDASRRTAPFLQVSWKAPSSAAIATYYTAEEAREKVRALDRTVFRGRQISAEVTERPQGAYTFGQAVTSTCVKIRGLPLNMHVDTEFSERIGTFNCRILNPASSDVEGSFTTIREHLSQAPGVCMDTFERLENGLGLEGGAKVRVQFKEWENAKKALASVDQLRERLRLIRGPYYKPWLPPKPVQYTIRIPLRQYEAQKSQWDALSERKKDLDAYVLSKIGNKGDIVFIQVMGQDKQAAGILKVRVESLVSGEKLNSTYWHSSFGSNQAKSFFNRVYSEKKVFVRTDLKTRSLKISGNQQMIPEARQMIKDEVDRLASREVTRVIDRDHVGFFVREGLQKLKELLGEENVQLNLNARPCRITVKGGEEATHHLQRLTEEARAAMTLGSILPGQLVETDTCPVCYDDASNPEELGCGHVYCSGCLKHFLTSAVEAKTFPLACAGNDATCNAPIAIPLIQRFLPAQTFHALVEAAFLSHLEKHGQEFKYCTTPDCKQIYRHRADQASLQCPSCFATVCPACDEEAHDGMSCEERRILKDPEEQERLNEELATQSGYKKCPQCKIWIEKTEGCNHMSCKCGAHICWRCMGVFASGDIYHHMQSAHGNIYDDVPAGVEVGNAPNHVFLAGQVDELARIERLRRLQGEHAGGVPQRPAWDRPAAARPIQPARQDPPPPLPARPAPNFHANLAQQRIEEQRREQRAAETREIEHLREIQEWARDYRRAQEEDRRRAVEAAAQIDALREREAREANQRAALQQLHGITRQPQRQPQQENRGWGCVVM